MDYDLRANGVDPKLIRLNEAQKRKSGEVIGAKYLVTVDLLGFSGNYQADSEITIPYVPGTLYFQVTDLWDPANKWGFGVETRIVGGSSTPWPNTAPSGGTFAVNAAATIKSAFTSEKKKAEEGFQKGMRKFRKELLENCGD